MEEKTTIHIEDSVRFFIFCPECRKILYKTPVEEMKGIYRRVALNTTESHNGFLGHSAEIFVRKMPANEIYEWTEQNFSTFQYIENKRPIFIRDYSKAKQDYEDNK